jgi:predicted RNA-binding Zn-ribbon protein involved in translation (DUF1610 family)
MAEESRLNESMESGESAVASGDTQKTFKCRQCGARMVYEPGTLSQTCPYCGNENPIPQSAEDIHELDFHAHLSEAFDKEDMEERLVILCKTCGAQSTTDPNVTAQACPFCGSDIVATAHSSRAIKPRSLLPFAIPRDQASKSFRSWIEGLWFAPVNLKKLARAENLIQGVYVPHWTYDCDTTSFYTGQRGDDYYVNESYTTVENGKTVRKTRRVKKTRWTSVRGTVWNQFDDVLILASKSLPRKHADKLEPWDLDKLTPYRDEFLSGFRAESYQIKLDEGFEIAREVMDGHIRASVCRDIGGDHQRIDSLSTQYDNITFKHILLPVWISAYRYNQKTYRFLVNGRSGKVRGERPWSVAKILLAVAGGAALISAIVLLVSILQKN